MQRFLQLVHEQFFYLEGNANALQTLYWVQALRDNVLHTHTQHLLIDCTESAVRQHDMVFPCMT